MKSVDGEIVAVIISVYDNWGIFPDSYQKPAFAAYLRANNWVVNTLFVNIESGNVRDIARKGTAHRLCFWS